MVKLSNMMNAIYCMIKPNIHLKNMSVAQSMSLVMVNMFTIYALLMTICMMPLKVWSVIGINCIYILVINASREFIVRNKVPASIRVVYVASLVIIFTHQVTFSVECNFDFLYLDILMCGYFTHYISQKVGTKGFRMEGFSILTVIFFSIGFTLSRVYRVGILIPTGYIHLFYLMICCITILSFLMILSISIDLVSSQEAMFHMQTQVDQLTNVKNRYFLYEQFSRMRKLNELDNKYIGMLDIDNFKQINDTYGHLCGDYVLVSVCNVIKEIVGENNIVRFGGEEFLAIVDELEKFETIRTTVENTNFSYENHSIHVTVSIGTSKYNSSYSIEKWVEKADKNVYKAKLSGKNTIVS